MAINYLDVKTSKGKIKEIGIQMLFKWLPRDISDFGSSIVDSTLESLMREFPKSTQFEYWTSYRESYESFRLFYVSIEEGKAIIHIDK